MTSERTPEAPPSFIDLYANMDVQIDSPGYDYVAGNISLEQYYDAINRERAEYGLEPLPVPDEGRKGNTDQVIETPPSQIDSDHQL